jgi:replicative DNA helicase
VTLVDDDTYHRNASSTERVPPHNLDAEQSLLGAMLLSRDAIEAAGDVGITATDFYSPAHGHIFDAVTRLHDNAQAVDTVTVAESLTRAGVIDAIGGPAALLALQRTTPATSNAGRYARIIQEHAVLRRLIGVASDIGELGYHPTDDVDGILDQAEQAVFVLAEHRRGVEHVFPVGELIDGHLDLLEARTEGTVTLGAPTGIIDLDKILGGLGPGQLIVVAGRPGMAKTTTGLTVAVNAAQAGHPSMFVSIEMARVELLDRLTASQARTSLERIRKGTLAINDWPHLAEARSALKELPFTIVDDPGASIGSIRSAVRRAARDGLEVVVVDYLQILHVTRQTGDRRVDVDEIARGLKRIARDFNVTVVALSQLNRGVEQRADKRPLLSDLRESGQIEQESDVVIGLYRDEYYREDSPDRGVLELIILKNRQGASGTTVRAAFLGEIQQITNMARAGER